MDDYTIVLSPVEGAGSYEVAVPVNVGEVNVGGATIPTYNAASLPPVMSFSTMLQTDCEIDYQNTVQFSTPYIPVNEAVPVEIIQVQQHNFLQVYI